MDTRASLSLLIIIFMCGLLSSPGHAYTQSQTLEQRFEKLQSVERSSFGHFSRKRAKTIGATYESLFASRIDNLEAVTDADLKLLFRAADLAAFYAIKPKYRRDMSTILAEMENRHTATNEDFSAMYGALIAARNFDRARHLRRTHPALDEAPLPTYKKASNINGSERTVLVISSNKRELTRKPLEMKPAQIVVVSDPLCHFSRNGLRDIESDPLLSRIFKKYSIWMTPTERHLNFDVIQKWNDDHPFAPFVLAYDQDEWPMLYTWALPTFYFFKDGSLAASVVGWPGTGKKTEIKAALDKIGLLPTPQ